MTSALEEAVEKNEDSRYISIALFVICEATPRQSGVISATSFDTDEVVYAAIQSKFCRYKQKDTGIRLGSCINNYQMARGGIELEGVIEIF